MSFRQNNHHRYPPNCYHFCTEDTHLQQNPYPSNKSISYIPVQVSSRIINHQKMRSPAPIHDPHPSQTRRRQAHRHFRRLDQESHTKFGRCLSLNSFPTPPLSSQSLDFQTFKYQRTSFPKALCLASSIQNGQVQSRSTKRFHPILLHFHPSPAPPPTV